jgi:RNA polymerase sigma factor (sigma-70 family)
VYSTALRQVEGDTHLAQDVAQTVFADLARKAAKLSRHPSLTGWLYTSAYFAGCKAVRTEHRRRVREQEAKTVHELLQATPGEDWDRVRPALDQAMHELKEPERRAILMRYFENQPFSEIGLQMGLSEDTARKRVDRALAKLQARFSKRGIATSASLAAALSAHAIQQAPAGLATALTTASLSGAAAQPGILTTLLKLMAGTKLQATAVSVIVLVGVVTPFALQQQAQARLRAHDGTLRDQTNQMARLTAQNEQLARLIAQVSSPALRAPSETRELLKLRNEVGQLRRIAQEMTHPTAAKPLSPDEKLARLRQQSAAQVIRLKQWLAEHPAEMTPEVKASPDEYWAEPASLLENDDNFAAASSKLRFKAEVTVLNELREAWQKYAAEHSDPIPGNLAALKPYLDIPLDDAVLQRYTLLPGRRLASPLGDIADWVLTQAAPVNAALDSRMGFGLTGINNILGEGVTNRWNLLP